MPYAQFAATTQFFLYGTRHFNKKGYDRHVKAYKDPEALTKADLKGKAFMVTGANSGVGKEIARFLAGKGASVHMICRSKERGEAARQELAQASPDADLHLWLADCGLERDVRKCWEDFSATGSRLDGVVCNAGALLAEKTLTEEGVEVTLASHLLFGSYLLGSLAMPALRATQGRVIMVSSGGMYNTKFPGWDAACALEGTYDGQLAYAYMKRAQVLLAERWADAEPAVKVVSCHPGWADTDGVEKAYGSKKSILEPMRTPWEGAEGICWLLACPREEIQSGAFYLDREPQVKHLAGPFFSEGSFTKNSEAEVASLMEKMESWTTGGRPSTEALQARHAAFAAGSATRQEGRLKPLDRPIDLQRFMGQWYVISHIPTFIDKNTVNGVEKYTWDEEKQLVNVEFTYMDAERTKTSSVEQTAKMVNAQNTEWKLRVKLGPLPLSLAYIIVQCAEDYSTCIVGDPGRSLLYIMARSPSVEAGALEELKNAAESAGYARKLIKDVPQIWDTPAPAPSAGG